MEPNGGLTIKPTRLSEIPLPSYNKGIYKWIYFHDRFISMVNRQTNLSDIERFCYLVICCKEDALGVIRGIPVSDNNHCLAWARFKERFDKSRLVAFSLIDKLLNAPKLLTEILVQLNKLLVVFDEGVLCYLC